MIFIAAFFVETILLFFLSRFLTRSLSKALLRITKSQTATINLLSFVFLPGVAIHELSHLLVASILFVRTFDIEFMPKMVGDGVKLGSVGIGATDPVRRAIIGFAPVVVGLSIIVGLVYFHPLSSFWGGASATTPESVSWRFWTSQNDGLSQWIKISVNILAFYLLFAISNTMFSSKKDLEGTLELLILFGILAVALYVVGFRADIAIPSFWLEKIIEIVKNIDLILLLPVGIDVIVVAMSSLLLAGFKSKL